MWLTMCPYDDQGLVRPLVTESGTVILFCDEAEHTWLHPDAVGREPPIIPVAPGWHVTPDVHIRYGTTHWATQADLEALGWDDLHWEPGPD